MIGLAFRQNSKWTIRTLCSEVLHSHPISLTTRCFHQAPILSTPKAQSPSRINSLYIDSPNPTDLQILAASKFFASHAPKKSWTATEWRQQPHSESASLIPEIVFLGRSNSGKSSLLNALLNDQGFCRVGPKPGKTAVMHAWSLSPIPPKTIGTKKQFSGDLEPKLTVLDMPGYGYGSHAEWGKSIVKYLTRRRQLRRAFVLINPVHGLKESDLHTLALLRSNGIAHQLIACKCDAAKPSELPQQLAGIGKSVEAHFSREQEKIALLTINDILAVGNLGDGRSNSRVKRHTMAGVDHVRWAIIRATGLQEYAMALIGRDGQKTNTKVEPLPKLQESNIEIAEPSVPIKPNQPTVTQIDYAQVQKPMQAPRPTQEPDAPVPRGNQMNSLGVGVGMDDLLSMVNHRSSRVPSTMPSLPEGSSISSSKTPSRRAQLRSRRQATNN